MVRWLYSLITDVDGKENSLEDYFFQLTEEGK